MRRLDVDVLVVGGGGSGVAAALFLGDLGVDHLVIERHPGTSPTPKAHYVNQRTMELFRLHGAADAIYAEAAPRDNMGRVQWLTSLGGDGPLDGICYHEQDGLGGGGLTEQYDAVGCTHPTNIGQNRLEPIVTRIAEQRRPGRIRFLHELVALTQDDDGVTAVVRDLDAGEDLEVRCRYLLAADAGKTVGPMVGVTMSSPTGMAMDSVSVTFEADLSRYFDNDRSVMRIIFHPSTLHRIGGLLAMGPNWTRHSQEWRVGFVHDPNDPDALKEEVVIAKVRDYLKIDDPIKITGVFHWHLETIVADELLHGRVIVVGDAAHQHPPGAGLGLNSGIHDVHNLAWKLAFVLQGVASPSLLATYAEERTPVVTRNAEWGLFTLMNRAKLIAAMGLTPGAPEGHNEAQFAKLMADTPDGASRRAVMNEIFRVQRMEYAAHDMEMGFYYPSGALVPDGTEPPWRDPMGSEYRPTSRPGSRLPHAWLHADGARVSTHDLIPLGGLLALTGARSLDWCLAAEKVAADLGVTIRAVRVGPGGDVADPSGAWARVREVGEDGVVLVRPDGHVAYRSTGAVADPYASLGDAVATVLGEPTTSRMSSPSR